MKKDKKSIIIICLVLLLIVTGTVYAAKVYEISFTNTFETGSVDVKIEQYEITDKGEQLVVPGEVMPNQDVSYIPRVTNLRAEAYVRVKVDINMERDIPRPITLNEVYNLNDEWVHKGDYFYLTKSLKTNESSDLFEGFHVPEEWTEDTACGFTFTVTVDAVQKVNFKPDFKSDNPWGSIEIEQAKLEDNIVYGLVKPAKPSPTFKYTSYNGLESRTTDLFENFSYFMAGDSYKDTLEMKNRSDNPILLYFKTETENRDLVSQMQVKITCDGKTVYKGSLHSTPLDKYKELTIVEPGKSKDFNFEVFLPDESKNYYTVLEDDVVWKFKCVEFGGTSEEDERDDDGGTDIIDGKGVQTGDDTNMFPFIVAGLLALFLIFALFITRKGEKENVKENN